MSSNWRGPLPEIRSGDDQLDGDRLRNLVAAVEVMRASLISFATYVGVNGMVIGPKNQPKGSLTITNGGGDARLVRVQMDDTTAGLTGNQTSACGFRYFIYPKGPQQDPFEFDPETRIQPLSLSPKKARTAHGKYVFYGNGLASWGLAALDPDATDQANPWMLLQVYGEVEDVTDC